MAQVNDSMSKIDNTIVGHFEQRELQQVSIQSTQLNSLPMSMQINVRIHFNKL